MSAPRIVCKPDVMLGKPCIEGTRITVELILDKLGAGETVDDILLDYSHINRDSILAAIRYGAAAVRNDIFYPVTVAPSATPLAEVA